MSLTALRQQLAAVIAAPPLPGGGIPTGIAALDAVLSDGGLPLGRLTEIVGTRGSGKTTLVREIVAQALADKRWVAYVDAGRTLAPGDWAALATTERLWIVRPPPSPPPPPRATRQAAMHEGSPARASPRPGAEDGEAPTVAHGPWCADVLLRSGAFGLVVLDGGGGLARGVAVRLTRLARESNAAFVVLREEGEDTRGRRAPDSGLVGGAVRLRVQHPVRDAHPMRGEYPGPPGRPRENPGTSKDRTGEAWESLGRRLAGDREERKDHQRRGSLRTPLVLQVTVEKGGTHHVVEVGCAIEVARRLCAHSQVPDRRGVATRNRRGERAAPDAPGIRRTAPPPDGSGGRDGAATHGNGAGNGATLSHKRRCAEPAIARDEFLLGPRHGRGSGERHAPAVQRPLHPPSHDARRKPPHAEPGHRT